MPLRPADLARGLRARLGPEEHPRGRGDIFADMRDPRHRRLIPVLLAVLQLGIAAVVPVLHAEVEVLSAGQAFESGHTDRCAIVHVEATCSLNSLPQVVSSTARDLPIARLPDQPAAHVDVPAALVSRHTFRANGVRAPPLA